MEPPPDRSARILVLARPSIGRRLEVALRSAGHEVHRTPDASATEQLAVRLRPGAVVVALDLPWGDALDAAHRVRGLEPPVPVLVLVSDNYAGSPNGYPRLPLDVDAGDLQAAVAELLDSSPDRVVHTPRTADADGTSTALETVHVRDGAGES